MFAQRTVMLAILLCVAQTALGQGLSKFRSPGVGNRSQAEAKESIPELRLSQFRPVAGAPFLVASLGRPHEFKGSFSKNSPGSPSGMVNYVFFDLADDTATTLLPNNESLILSLDALPNELGQSSHSHESPRKLELTSAVEQRLERVATQRPVRWHSVEYVSADTDADGELSAKDRHSFGIADAGGRGFVEVIPNLGQIFSQTMIDSETLHVIHGSQAKQIAVRIN
ncbi:MAG: hypothetical protein FJ267_09365, partial [Planctomycetes bacterium]|nr:hypothetical protein [Planctomycetota bacterium]